jgi:hypothetical protein
MEQFFQVAFWGRRPQAHLDQYPVVRRQLPSLTFALDSVIFRTTGRHGPDVVANPVEVGFALAGAAGVVATASWCLRPRRTAATQS